MEIYQIVRVKEMFRCSQGFSKLRLEKCFESFQTDNYLGKLDIENTSWLFMSEASARSYCERHNTCSDDLLNLVGSKEVVFQRNYYVNNSVFD